MYIRHINSSLTRFSLLLCYSYAKYCLCYSEKMLDWDTIYKCIWLKTMVLARWLISPVFVILQVHLNEPITMFKFLSLLWGYNSNLGDQLDCRISAILQTQALYVGNALLCNQPKKNLNLLASGSSPGMSIYGFSHIVSVTYSMFCCCFSHF